jgi:hypothetical protein
MAQERDTDRRSDTDRTFADQPLPESVSDQNTEEQQPGAREHGAKPEQEERKSGERTSVGSDPPAHPSGHSRNAG